MTSYNIQIKVRFKTGILDPQAEAIQSALEKLSFKGIESIECDKVYGVKLKAKDEAEAAKMGRDMANKLLANVVMENFEVEVAV